MALYLHGHGADRLPYSLSDLARTMGIEDGSLQMRAGNFTALSGEGGLENWAKQSERVFESHRQAEEAELRQRALDYVASLGSSKA